MGGMVLKHQRERIYSESELAKATNNYDDHQKLGQGGFDCVYKGVLPDYTQLAIKKFKGVDKAQMNEEFQHEIGYKSIAKMWSKAIRAIFADQRAFTSLQIHLKRNPFSS